jgi:hypothetical protein
MASPFPDPFPGHLPGYLTESERTSPGRPDPDTYDQFLMERWQALLDSEDSRDESLLQAFLEYYDIPPEIARRKLEPRYVLVHGRRDNFESIPRRREKRAALARPVERLMSFDRLTPAKNSVLYSTVRKGQDGYRVISVPPSLTLFNTGEDYQLIAG